MATKSVWLGTKQNPHKCCPVYRQRKWVYTFLESIPTFVFHSFVPLVSSVVLHLDSRGSPASFFGSSVALPLSSASEFSLAAGLDGPGVEAETELPLATPPTISELPAVCMIFCLTSRIFSCRHTLLGNVSEWRAWKAAVACAVPERKKICKLSFAFTTMADAFFLFHLMLTVKN